MGAFKVVFLVMMVYGYDPQIVPIPGLTYKEAVISCNIAGQYLMNHATKWSTYQCIREDATWEDDAATPRGDR